MTNTNPIDAALDAAAPTKELWLKGKNVFLNSIASDSGNTEQAYYNALDAAAPDEESWIRGRNVLVLNGVHLLPGSKGFARKSVDVARRIRLPKVGVFLGVVIGILGGFVLAFCLDLLVTNVLPVMNPILWLLQLLAVVAGIAFGYRAATKPRSSTESNH